MVHASSPYEEMFVRRNAILLFLQRYFSPSTLDFQTIALCSDIPRISPPCLPRLTDLLHMRVSILLFPSYLHLETFLTPNTAQLTMCTTPNAPVCFCPLLYLSLLPSLISRRSRRPRSRLAMGKPGKRRRGRGDRGEIVEGR